MIKVIILTIVFSLLGNMESLDAQNKKGRASTPKEIKTESSDPLFYFMEGLRWYHLADYDNAEQNFIKSIELDSNNDAANYYLYNINLGRRELDKAESYFRRALEIDPGNYWYRIMIAQFYARTEREEVAIKLYEDLKRDYPKRSSLYYDMIYIYAGAQQIDKALETLDHIENISGRNDLTAITRWELMNMQQKFGEANAFILDYGQLSSTPRISTIMGDIYMQQYEDTLALDSYNRAIYQDPSFYPAYFGAAEVYRTRRQYDKFFEYITPFISSRDSGSEMKTRYLNNILSPAFIQAFRPQMDSLMINLHDAHPSDTTVSLFTGSYFISVGETDKGLDYFQKNLEENPYIRSSTMEYIYMLSYLSEWDRLFKVAEKGLEIFPDDPEIMQSIGIAYWNMNNLPKSIDTYHKIEKIVEPGSPESISAQSILGDLYYQSGNGKKAYKYYEKVLKIDPSNTHVLNNYAYYLSQEGKNLKKAYQMSKKTVEMEPDNTTFLDTYGWILYLMGQYEESKSVFKHAINYGGKESAVIMDHYGDVLYALGDYVLSEVYWENANKMDPTLGINKGHLKK